MAKTLMLIAAGGACGAVARFGVVTMVGGWGAFPWGTMLANLVGCFAVGILVGSVWDTPWFQEYGRYFLVFGLLGAFTTFSSFSVDSLALFDEGRVLAAGSYTVASVVGCLAAAWVGIRLAG